MVTKKKKAAPRRKTTKASPKEFYLAQDGPGGGGSVNMFGEMPTVRFYTDPGSSRTYIGSPRWSLGCPTGVLRLTGARVASGELVKVKLEVVKQKSRTGRTFAVWNTRWDGRLQFGRLTRNYDSRWDYGDWSMPTVAFSEVTGLPAPKIREPITVQLKVLARASNVKLVPEYEWKKGK